MKEKRCCDCLEFKGLEEFPIKENYPKVRRRPRCRPCYTLSVNKNRKALVVAKGGRGLEDKSFPKIASKNRLQGNLERLEPVYE